MNQLLENKVLRYGALALLLQAVLSHPLEYCVYVVTALVIYYSKDTDLEVVKDIKNFVSNLDLSKLKSLIKSAKKEVSEVEEVIAEPSSTYKEQVDEALGVEKEFEAVSKSKGFAKESK